MRLTLKLFATLGQFLPPGAKANAIEVDVPDGATPHMVIDQFAVPRAKIHLVMVNGFYIHPADRDRRPLEDGDVLAIWPPVAGG
jgi:molybdopterin converting factor small subunit